MTGATDEQPTVRFETGLGWICSCTGVYVERVDFSLDCHHWPLCEHVFEAARAAVVDVQPFEPVLRPKTDR